MLHAWRETWITARQAGGDAIRKWEDFEKHSLPLTLSSLALLGGLVATERADPGLMLLGAVSGFSVVSLYAAIFAGGRTLTHAAVVLTTLLVAASAAAYSELSLGWLMANGLGTTVLVVSVAALCSRRWQPACGEGQAPDP